MAEGVVESASVSHSLQSFCSSSSSSPRCSGQLVPPAPSRRPCVNTRISALYPITARGHPPPIPSRTLVDEFESANSTVASSPACFTTKCSFSLSRSLQAPLQQCLSRTPQAWSHGACSSGHGWFRTGHDLGSVCAVNGGATCQGSTRPTTINFSRVVTTSGDDLL